MMSMAGWQMKKHGKTGRSTVIQMDPEVSVSFLWILRIIFFVQISNFDVGDSGFDSK